MSEPERPIDAALFDADTAASDDFYRHVNGGWLDANPVPSEYGSWGAPQIVHARNQVVLHQLLEDAAANGCCRWRSKRRRPVSGWSPRTR